MALYGTALGQKLPDTRTVQPWSTLQENANKQILEDAILEDRSALQQIRDALVAARVPAGVVQAYDGLAAPTGYVLCQGQSLLRASYPDLFTAIGVQHGSVSALHFNAPNYKGRALIGLDSAQTEFDLLGRTAGLKSTNHASWAPPQNSAQLQIGGSNYDNAVRTQINNFITGGGSTASSYGVSIQNVGGVVQGQGGSAAEVRHLQYTTTNLQPYAVVQYIIKI